MALLATRGPDYPSTSRTERDRIRELSKCVQRLNYCAFTHPDDDGVSYGRVAPSGNEQPGAAYLSPGITINALAQLGVLRFGCNRSFVSIIDGENQHIIAETTSSMGSSHSISKVYLSRVVKWTICWIASPAMEIQGPRYYAHVQKCKLMRLEEN